MSDYLGRCTARGCPFRFRDGRDRLCRQHEDPLDESLRDLQRTQAAVERRGAIQ
jgi:hypothetical protein